MDVQLRCIVNVGLQNIGVEKIEYEGCNHVTLMERFSSWLCKVLVQYWYVPAGVTYINICRVVDETFNDLRKKTRHVHKTYISLFLEQFENLHERRQHHS